MKKKYTSPTVIVRYISTENILGWSIFIDDDTPKPGIQGDAKRASKVVDDSEGLDEWDELEDSMTNNYGLPIF